ncbi:MAG: 50S ribosomal protein L21 [Pirellulales bacterium]
MYAIIADSGRQYRIEEGQVLDLDYRELSAGEELKIDRVLALGGGDGGFQFGRPLLDSASVTAEVVGVVPGEKITVQKFRRRKNSRRKTGHRQLYTRVKIKSITG